MSNVRLELPAIHHEGEGVPHLHCPDVHCCPCDCLSCKKKWREAGRPTPKTCPEHAAKAPTKKHVVHRYEFPLESEFELEVPSTFGKYGSRILHVEAKDGYANMWVERNVDDTMMKAKFRLFATGEEFDPDSVSFFVGSFLIERRGVTLVFHLYRAREQ